MNLIDIGIPINLENLYQTRMLINAGSGGGKSWLIRRLAETCSGNIHQIIFDYEGEFVTLREKFPFALVAVKDGDIPLSIHHAGKLAAMVMETALSVIIDLYELEPDDRVEYVHVFLHALMNLSRDVYHPTLVFIDEIDVFCPQSGKTAASKDVRNLAARGRKKGLAIIAATQRLSKVNKDVAAECQNKMIGQTTLGMDRDRAGEELGLPNKERSVLIDLDPGNFLAYGPAISKKVVPFKVSEVETTHVKAGTMVKPPPTPDAIREIVSQLKDMPEESAVDDGSLESMRQEITRLKEELAKAKSGESAADLKEAKDKLAIARVSIQDILKKLADRDSILREIRRLTDPLEGVFNIMPETMAEASTTAAPSIFDNLSPEEFSAGAAKLAEAIFPVPAYMGKGPAAGPTEPGLRKEKKAPQINPENQPSARPAGGAAGAILNFVGQFRDKAFTKAQIGILTGYSPNSGGFNNALSALTTKGWILRDGGKIRFNPTASKNLGPVQKRKYSVEQIKSKLSKCEREIYEVLLRYRHKFNKEDLAAKTESAYSANSGGFNNALSRLTTLEIIVRTNGIISLNPDLLELI